MLTVTNKKGRVGTSLVVQWLRIHLPMQGTQVQPLAEELRSHMPRGNEAHKLLLNLHATTRESVCRNKISHMMQVRSCMLQLRHNAAKLKRNLMLTLKNYRHKYGVSVLKKNKHYYT